MTQKVTFSLIANAAVNVTDKGAAGNGTADDTAEIQAALTAGAGGSVFFPGGTYKISDSLLVPSNTVLIFDPSVNITVAAGAFTAGDAILKIDKKTNVTIHGNGATLTGQREGSGTSLITFGVAITGSSHVRVNDLYFANLGGDGLTVQESEDDTIWYSENIWIERCRAYNCMRNGFSLVSGKSVWFKDCVASTTNGKQPQSGFYVEPTGGSTLLVNCVFDNCVGTMNTYAQFHTVIGNNVTVITTDIDLVFNNCRAIDSTTANMIGFDINSHKAVMPNDGRLLLSNCIANNIDSYGLAIRNIDKAGQQVTISNFQAIDCNTGARTTYGGNAPVAIHASSSVSWPNPGGVRINGLKIVDNTADRSPYYITSAGTAHDDIQILDFEWINSIGRTNYPFMDAATTDTLIEWVPGPYNVSRVADITLSARYNGWILDNFGSTGTITFLLPVVATGLIFYFEVHAAFALRITPNAADSITPDGVADGKYMESSQPGATAIIYANRSADNWIVERTGTWTDEP